MNFEKEKQAAQYIKQIKNIAKKAYAAAYWHYLNTTHTKEPQPFDLSYMAAQAVRIKLDSIFKPE